jgi:hypothetical protein
LPLLTELPRRLVFSENPEAKGYKKRPRRRSLVQSTQRRDAKPQLRKLAQQERTLWPQTARSGSTLL